MTDRIGVLEALLERVEADQVRMSRAVEDSRTDLAETYCRGAADAYSVVANILKVLITEAKPHE
jgi:hypothetical protein